MSEKYKTHESEKAYFVTLTVVGWFDLFTRKNYKFTIVDSLKYCQQHKGLEIYGWCLMTNHLHMICRGVGENTLSDILRDFKKFTSKKLIEQITEEPESRRNWLLSYFRYYGKTLKRVKNYKVWQDGNHPEIIYSPKFYKQKLNCIHLNPVKEMIVSSSEDYLFSSARNYAELDSVLDVVVDIV